VNTKGLPANTGELELKDIVEVTGATTVIVTGTTLLLLIGSFILMMISAIDAQLRIHVGAKVTLMIY
jgi:hypothetical protein